MRLLSARAACPWPMFCSSSLFIWVLTKPFMAHFKKPYSLVFESEHTSIDSAQIKKASCPQHPKPTNSLDSIGPLLPAKGCSRPAVPKHSWVCLICVFYEWSLTICTHSIWTLPLSPCSPLSEAQSSHSLSSGWTVLSWEHGFVYLLLPG